VLATLLSIPLNEFKVAGGLWSKALRMGLPFNSIEWIPYEYCCRRIWANILSIPLNGFLGFNPSSCALALATLLSIPLNGFPTQSGAQDVHPA
jgi:hypothetical protein